MVLSYKQFTPTKTASFIDKLNKAQKVHGLNKNTTKILGQNLSFAPGWVRVECEDYSEMPHIKQSYLTDDTTIVPFVYGPDPRHDIFKDVSLDITADNVIEYLTIYFGAFLQNGERIIPVFHADDISWQEDLTPMLKKSLETDFAKYPQIISIEDRLRVKFLCVFHQAIMQITCFVDAHGLVEMTDRAVLTDDLPINHLP